MNNYLLTQVLNPDLILQYLTVNKWTPLRTWNNDVKIFVKLTKEDPDQEEADYNQVTVPLEPSFSDYDTALQAAVKDIAVAEYTSVETILINLLSLKISTLSRTEIECLAYENAEKFYSLLNNQLFADDKIKVNAYLEKFINCLETERKK